MNDPKSKPDVPPSPERDTSRKGREEEVINQQEEDQVTNKGTGKILNGNEANNTGTGERQYKEGMGDNTVKLDGVDKDIIEGSDRTGNEESGIPGSGI